MKIKHILLCCLAAFSAIFTSAQTPQDLGSWCSLMAVKKFGKASAAVRLENRSYQKISKTECWFASASMSYTFNKWLSGEAGYEYWEIPSAGSLKYHKAVAGLIGSLRCDNIAVSLRGKFEFAFNAATGDPSGLLRTRLKTQWLPDNSIACPYIMCELFNGFNGKGWIRSLNYVGTELKLSLHHNIDLFYMYHIFPVEGMVSSCHLLGAGYTFFF